MNRLLYGTICLIFSLILGAVFIYPRYQELKTVRITIERREEELQSKERYFADLREVSEKLEQYEPQLAIIESALPEKPDLPALLDFLQKLSSQSGLVLKDLRPNVAIPVEGFREIEVILVLEGPYSSLKNFLSALEKSGRIIEPKSVSFSVPSEETNILTFNLKIKTNSY